MAIKREIEHGSPRFRTGERERGAGSLPGKAGSSVGSLGIDVSGGLCAAAVPARGHGNVADTHARVTVMQRSRLLAAAVSAVAEFGWEDASVARITQRARVSRRTFYEVFENREECLVAVLESAVERIAAEFDAAGLATSPWLERVRGGLWAILCFFDREPAYASVCMVESRRAGAAVLDYRQKVFDGLTAIVDEGRDEASRTAGLTVLTAHGVVGGVCEVLYSQTLSSQASLRGLLGELMGMIALPYLGVAAARREQVRRAPTVRSSRRQTEKSSAIDRGERDPLAELPMRLTYRTATVLQALAEHPRQSNREVADLVGISDQGQISKLLSRLARLGLLTNAAAVGRRNKWELTATGDQVTHSIKTYTEPQAGHVIKGGAQHAF